MIPPVVDPARLPQHPDAVLADVRWYPDDRSPREAYDAGHLPGAGRLFPGSSAWRRDPARRFATGAGR